MKYKQYQFYRFTNIINRFNYIFFVTNPFVFKYLVGFLHFKQLVVIKYNYISFFSKLFLCNCNKNLR